MNTRHHQTLHLIFIAAEMELHIDTTQRELKRVVAAKQVSLAIINNLGSGGGEEGSM